MSADQTCRACGYRIAAQAAQRLRVCPRCGTPRSAEAQKAPEAPPAKVTPLAGDLSDLEISDSDVAADITEDDTRKTHARPKEPAWKAKKKEKEITDRQEKEIRAEKIAVQERLAVAFEAPPSAPEAKPEPPPKAEKARPKAEPSPIRVSAPRSAPRRDKSSVTKLLGAFGPVLLVCILFLGWVVYDRLGRPSSQTEQLLSQAVSSFQKGDRETARKLVAKALQQDPTSELVKKLQTLFEKSK